jgi:hypothetical protein
MRPRGRERKTRDVGAKMTSWARKSLRAVWGRGTVLLAAAGSAHARVRGCVRAGGCMHARKWAGSAAWSLGRLGLAAWEGGARAGSGMQAAQGGGGDVGRGRPSGGRSAGPRGGGERLGPQRESALRAREWASGVALGRAFDWAAQGGGMALGRRGGLREASFPFVFLHFFHFLFSYYQILFTINELHIKWIHTKAKHHTNTNIYFRMMHQSLFL